MKIAISSGDGKLASEVFPRFGRAPWFLVVETGDGDVAAMKAEAVTNTQNVEAAQGAGIQSAQCVVGLGAEAVLTGHCGPKAFRTLQAAGVALYAGVDGTAADAVARFVSGQLQPADEADVEGHW